MKQFIFIAGKMISILMMLVTSIPVSAQNYSGLQHKYLPQNKIKEAIVSSILDAIINSDFTGDIEKVKVTEDYDVSLTLNISFWGFREGFVQASLADENLNRLKGFTPQKAKIEPDKKQVELHLQLDPNSYAENESFVAPRLVVLVTKTEGASQGVKRIYKLNKRFTNPISPENIIIPVSLVPVGSAASLPASLPVDNPAIPQRNVYEAIKNKSVLPT